MELASSDPTSQINEFLVQQNEFLWFMYLFGRQDIYQPERTISYGEKALKKSLEKFPAFWRENMKAPEDAYIGEYSESAAGFEIVPDTLGTKCDMNKVLECVGEALIAQEEEIDLDAEGCYAEASIKASDHKLNDYLTTANRLTSTSVTYDWHGSEVLLDGDRIHQWITFERNKPMLDEEAVKEFISSTASELDTYGKKKKFTTSLGIEITITNSRYGWKVDRAAETDELLKLIYAGSKVEREPEYAVTAVEKGNDDIGSSYVEIDLSNQHLYLYQKGVVVLESDFVSGNMSNGNGTPGGIFGLTYKTKNAILRGDNYATPVNYWMPFNGNVGMHDATWRGQFGGDIFLTSGSHGCINLPLGKAREMYEYVSTGFPVICYYY